MHPTTQPPGVPDYWPNLDLWESHDSVVRPVMNPCPVRKHPQQTCYERRIFTVIICLVTLNLILLITSELLLNDSGQNQTDSSNRNQHFFTAVSPDREHREVYFLKAGLEACMPAHCTQQQAVIKAPGLYNTPPQRCLEDSVNEFYFVRRLWASQLITEKKRKKRCHFYLRHSVNV